MFDPESYLDVRKPLLEASTLPPQCYTSPEFFQRELERCFLPQWQFVGREEQLSEPGQFFCYEGVGGSIIILRDRDGELKAFANSCRHRGARLLTDSGSCKRIVCPYHRWTYQLDGDLIAAPGMNEAKNFELANYPLLEIHLDTWAGFLFINYQADPGSLLDQLGSMPSKFSGHSCEEMRLVGKLEFEINSNWKLLVENALEAYHTGSVHRQTLGQQDSRAIETSAGWAGLLVLDEQSVATMSGEEKPFPHIPGLGEEAVSGAYFTVLYPSTQFVFAQDCIWWLAFDPASVDRTRLSIGACFPQSTIDLADFEDRVKPYFDRWQRATAEDNAICEMQHQGQKFSRPPGRFSADEFAVHALSNWVLDQILDR